MNASVDDPEPLELSEAYVHSLASLGLERLQNEPGRLHSEAVAVDEALHTLSLDHYHVFIQNQECVRHVRAQGKEMEGHLSSLLTEVHGLAAEFSVFQREAAELVGGHKRNRQTLKHHMQLVELLEVPQLMDACVRSDLLEEALSIATFASTLERRHRSRRVVTTAPPSSIGGDIDGRDEAVEGHLPGVIKMIVEEVRQSAKGLHERLVAKLRGPIQLTSCLQVVSCLRRLELLELEEQSEKIQQRQRQRALARQKDADAKGSSLKNGGADGMPGGSRRKVGLRPKGEGAPAGEGKIEGGSGGRVGVSQRQLALVEMKLQVDFLEARDAWLADAASRTGGHGGGGDLQQQALGAASNGATVGPYQALMDLIESSRSQWFEVATQFRAVFLSVDGGSRGPTAPAGGGRKAHLSSPGTGDGLTAGSGRDGGDVLSLWLLRRVSAFVEQLKGLLTLVEDGGLLRSLLEECMFFGASMGRLGTDFRGLLVPVFEERVSGAAAGQWATASAEFVATLRDIAAIEAAGGNGSSLLHIPDKATIVTSGSAAAAEAEKVTATATATYGQDGGIPPPPRSLMVFPPVARLLNLVLTSFNQLRECLPASVEDRLADALVLCLTDAFRGMADLKKSTLRANAAAASASASASAPSPGSPAARGGGGGVSTAPSSWRGGGGEPHLNTTSRAVELACSALAKQAVPYLALCFAALFGESPTLAALAGLGDGKPAATGGRAEKLRTRLLGALETFGLYEPPPAPSSPPSPAPAHATPTAPATSSPGPTAGAAALPPAPASATASIPAASLSPVLLDGHGPRTAEKADAGAVVVDGTVGGAKAAALEEGPLKPQAVSGKARDGTGITMAGNGALGGGDF